MTDFLKDNFKGIEQAKRLEINELMKNWRHEVENNRKIKRDCYFASDGFFPGYFNQKQKVLFIAREAKYMTADGYDDYVATFMKVFFERDNQNKSSFIRWTLYIVEGIKNNGMIKFKDVKKKSADKIAKEMLATNNYGYAVMNVSKYSNERSDGGTANKSMIKNFLEHSSINGIKYFKKELEILTPDIIITGHLWNGIIHKEYLKSCFNFDIDKQKPNKSKNSVDLYEIKLNNKSTKLINTYHFSSRNKSDENDFYNPVMKLVFER